jgi:hypothetical protein
LAPASTSEDDRASLDDQIPGHIDVAADPHGRIGGERHRKIGERGQRRAYVEAVRTLRRLSKSDRPLTDAGGRAMIAEIVVRGRQPLQRGGGKGRGRARGLFGDGDSPFRGRRLDGLWGQYAVSATASSCGREKSTSGPAFSIRRRNREGQELGL